MCIERGKMYVVRRYPEGAIGCSVHLSFSRVPETRGYFLPPRIRSKGRRGGSEISKARSLVIRLAVLIARGFWSDLFIGWAHASSRISGSSSFAPAHLCPVATTGMKIDIRWGWDRISYIHSHPRVYRTGSASQTNFKFFLSSLKHRDNPPCGHIVYSRFWHRPSVFGTIRILANGINGTVRAIFSHPRPGNNELSARFLLILLLARPSYVPKLTTATTTTTTLHPLAAFEQFWFSFRSSSSFTAYYMFLTPTVNFNFNFYYTKINELCPFGSRTVSPSSVDSVCWYRFLTILMLIKSLIILPLLLFSVLDINRFVSSINYKI